MKKKLNWICGRDEHGECQSLGWGPLNLRTERNVLWDADSYLSSPNSLKGVIFLCFLKWKRKPSLFCLESRYLKASTLYLRERKKGELFSPYSYLHVFWSAAFPALLNLLTHLHLPKFFLKSPLLVILKFSFLLWGVFLLLVFTIMLLGPWGRGNVKEHSQNIIWN